MNYLSGNKYIRRFVHFMDIKVNESTCTGCSLCRLTCLYDAIEIIEGIAKINENCVFCGACIDACKVDSIKITGS